MVKLLKVSLNVLFVAWDQSDYERCRNDSVIVNRCEDCQTSLCDLSRSYRSKRISVPTVFFEALLHGEDMID